ncbi:MAG: prephenate dehydrogenase [Synergistaceae bacterium]|jgi:prephenate dehydrogenase|nr:prephenate dehydrogenase [Synergistaceae bacterium]
MKYRICVIGLGLMGASLAGALRGFRKAEIHGVDVKDDVRKKAERTGVVDRAFAGVGEGVTGANLVIFCVYAHNIPAMIEKNKLAFSPNAVLSDICGVKTQLYEKLSGILPEHIDYVGIHPMAGKERDGFDNADPAIYKNSGMIICPFPNTMPGNVELLREMAKHIGVARLAVASPREHDDIIAYTSDLMHIAAAGLCIDYHPDITPAFTAGAFRDCTRVADINASAWTELILDNRENTLPKLDSYIENLNKMREAISDGDEARLYSLLDRACGNKRTILRR